MRIKIFNFLATFILFKTYCAFSVEEYAGTVLKLQKNETFLKEFDDHIDYLLSIDPNYFEGKQLSDFEFECSQTQEVFEPATSVHELKPSDIKVVAALGDSITAAFGAKARTVLGLLNEYRGVSWTIGADQSIFKSRVTLPNIFKKFNPSLTGYNKGQNLFLFGRSGIGLNAAVSGAEANDIPGQVKILIERLKASKDLDWENDWKMISLFIGGNDLCRYSKDKEFFSPANYIRYIEEALDLLQQELPKTFVNLIMVLDISELKFIDKYKPCTLLLHVACPYIAFPDSPATEQEIINITSQYQVLTDNLINSGKYNTKDDFTVVVQPFLRNFDIPRLKNGKIDYSYVAPDCFHFSAKTHGNKLRLLLAV